MARGARALFYNTLGADKIPAGLLTSEQSRLLLAKTAKLTPDQLLPQAADLLRECGNLPLALTMIGAMLRDKPPSYWTHVLNLLLSADLTKIKAQFPEYPHADLLRAIRVSVDVLDPQTRERYLALAVLLEDMPAHPEIQRVLWNTKDFGALETAEQLISLSLAQRDEETGGIRLHDLQLDYVRAQYPDRDSLQLIHGAIRLSSHVIARDPWQFVSQITGRLIAHEERSDIYQFTNSLAEAAPKPWLRNLKPTLHQAGTALLRTLEGHSGRVTGVALTPDERRAASVADDGTLKLWNLESGHELRTFQANSGWLTSVAVSPDGRKIVSGSCNRTLKVWDLESGRELHTLRGHSEMVTDVVMSPDGLRAVSASSDKTLKVWDLESGRELHTLRGHSEMVTDVVVSPDGLRAVSTSSDKTLKVWDLESGHELRTVQVHDGSASRVAVSPEGQRAVSVCGGLTLKMWDVESGRELPTFVDQVGHVTGLAVNRAWQRMVCGRSDGTLTVLDLESGRELRTLRGHASFVECIAISTDGRHAVSGSSDSTLKVWDLQIGDDLP